LHASAYFLIFSLETVITSATTTIFGLFNGGAAFGLLFSARAVALITVLAPLAFFDDEYATL